MRVKVQKWGNSLALRIPKPFAEEVDVREGAILDLSVRDRKLVATPAKPARFTLRQLLRRVTKANTHEEADWGRAIGREAW
jgi:antitoxin MazE